MAGRRLCSDSIAIARGFRGAECARRRDVLRETLMAFERCEPPDRYHERAADNLRRWRDAAQDSGPAPARVVRGDWGDVTLALTQRHGTCFAVLNMANACVAGGAYVEGAVAQEENMFRRTDCHFRVGADEFDVEADRYRAAMTRLLEGSDGIVHLDTRHPRVCIRGPEDRGAPDLGYRWLADDEVFPFYELRAAAQDLRGGAEFSVDEARRRVAAQLDTLRSRGLRHAVLGASGCGAFRNPADAVARLYREELAARPGAFDVIAFAILGVGSRDNYTPFAQVFGAGDVDGA